MSSNWPIDGKVAKATRNNYVYPEKKGKRERSPSAEYRDKSPSQTKRDRSLSADRRRRNSIEQEQDQQREAKLSETKYSKNKKPKASIKKNTYECCSKSCGKFIRLPLWFEI